jgi:cytochrome c biogenesis protein CcmG, thiol:disulfide interchange protein DsbE
MLTSAKWARLFAAVLMLIAGPAVAKELKPWNGDLTPPLELRDLSGRVHRLADYRGQVVLINFWATWCEPCRDEMPAMQALKTKLGGKPFAVLAVNVAESEVRIDDFLRTMPLDFIVLHDRDSSVMKAWRVRALPASFVVGPDGRIRYSFTGEFEWADDKVVKVISGLMRRRQ